MRSSAGGMPDRLRFESRAVTSHDGAGNVRGDWTPEFIRSAEVRPQRGSEVVISARLQGTVPVTIIVRSDSNTRRIAADWRAVDIRSGVVYALKAVYDAERERAWITMDAVLGEAP